MKFTGPSRPVREINPLNPRLSVKSVPLWVSAVPAVTHQLRSKGADSRQSYQQQE